MNIGSALETAVGASVKAQGDFLRSHIVLVAAWFQRNIRIYRNILALIDSPSDKIFVIYGSGHLGWLQQNIAKDCTARFRKLADLTRRP